jgi:hypothetical protein
MPELSSLLRQRLQAGETARLQHPDADTLTAYVEQLLPLSERKLVLEHIAACSDCREILFLAIPENAAVAGPEAVVPEALVPDAATPIPTRRRWFLTPGFGLVASIATMAAAITLVIEIPHRNQPLTPASAPVRVEDKLSKVEAPRLPQPESQTNQAAPKAAESSPAAPLSQPSTSRAAANPESARANSPQPGPQPGPQPKDIRVPEKNRTLAGAGVIANKSGMAGRDSRARLSPETMARVTAAKGDQINGAAIGGLAEVTAAAPVLEARAAEHDYLNAQRFAKDSGNSLNGAAGQADLPSAPIPSSNGLAYAKQSTLLSGNWQQPGNAYLAIPEAKAQTSQGMLSFTPPPPEHQSLLSKIIEVGKRPIKRAEPALQSRNVTGFAMFNNGLAVQHSDPVIAASTAEKADSSSLASSPAFTARGFGSSRKSFVAGAAPYRWKIAQGKLLKSADSAIWIDAYSATDGIEFSAVTANGSQIWAGGNRGQLVHSRDSGTTWEKAALGDATVGNVVSIEIQGLNVHVVTAPSQGWSSLDGGKTWIKLPQ